MARNKIAVDIIDEMISDYREEIRKLEQIIELNKENEVNINNMISSIEKRIDSAKKLKEKRSH